jgi:glycosyltransferase involved in cell wall biosynthesis
MTDTALRKYIHAPNIHCGGGRVLLDALIRAAEGDTELLISADARFVGISALTDLSKIRRVKPTLLHRLMAERWLVRHIRPGDHVLCFGNLPPLWKLKGKTTLFLQNRLLLNKADWAGFPFRSRLRLLIERHWLLSRLHNIDHVIVQTTSMKQQLEACSRMPLDIHVLPFVAEPRGYSRKLSPEKTATKQQKSYRFAYVASGDAHKNHHALLNAWRILAAENIFPELHLTIDAKRHPSILHQIAELSARHAISVHNHDDLKHEEILRLYQNVDAAIYPSLLESFGLPLIEARQAGLPILAAETDYVRDILDPEESFDPHSPVSIARAVQRFMGIPTETLPVLDASTFLQKIFAPCTS